MPTVLLAARPPFSWTSLEGCTIIREIVEARLSQWHASFITVLTAQVTIDGLACSMMSKVALPMNILCPGGTDLSFSQNSVLFAFLYSSSRISPINGFVVPLSIASPPVYAYLFV